ncbi:CPBP family intramembrane metalloprotease, partial [Romboutsia maritimum]
SIYMVYVFYLTKYLYNNDLIIRLKSITISNISIKLLDDFLSSLFIVIIILSITLIRKQSLSTIGITKNNSILVFILLAVYFGIFFIKGDFSLIGIYKCFFYLMVVSFSEELIFRGYLFTALDREIPTYLAVLISGIMWGAMHAFIPIIINNYSVMKSVSAICSELGGGIVFGGIYILIYKKSKSLIIPIMIHAILDFINVLF